MKTKFPLLKAAALAFALLAAPGVRAGLLQTQSNPVSFGGLYWGNPTNWDTLNIPRYQADSTNDGTFSRDINFISIAHDAYYFYVRLNFKQAPPFNGSDFYFWIDADTNAATGSRDFSGNGAIGSEYVVVGASMIQDPSAWNWNGWVNWDQNPWDAGDLPRDIIITINRAAQMPGVKTFDFVYQLYNSGSSATGDWYPDSADTLSGDFFRYTTGDAPEPTPTSSSTVYRDQVVTDAPLAYYRLSETTPPALDIATNSGSLGTNGNGAHTIGSLHPVAGAISGDSDTATRYSAVDPNSTDGGVPTLVPWPEKPLIRELWDNTGIGNLNNKGGGTSSIGLDSTTNWHVNLGNIMKVAQDFDITAPPGPPYSRGQTAGLWADDGDIGSLGHYWDTRAWATRRLASNAQINFGTNGDYWITVRINNGGDTAMGIGFANGGDGAAQFLGVGAMWNSAGGGTANNALYVSDGTLGTDSPYAIRANSAAETINGPGLIVAHLTTSNGGSDTIDAAVYKPGDTIPTDPSGFFPQVSYSFTSTMTATHLVAWLNGDTSPSPFGGQLDAIRVTTSFGAMFNGAMNTPGSFTVEAWLRPTIPGAGNAQAPLFNSDAATETVGWDFYQRAPGSGWNFVMFNDTGGHLFDVTGGSYTVGQWTHLVAVYDATVPSATLYVDGAVANFSTFASGTYRPNPSSPLSIGGYSDASQNPFTGDIDEVAVYTNALSAADVLAHYANGTNSARATSYSALVQSKNPVEYLRLGEPAKNVAANSGTLGSAADGVFNLFTANGRSGPRAPADLGFESNNTAAFFDGSTSYVELRNPSGLNFSGQITLEAWVQPSVAPAASGAYGDIIAHGYDEDFNELVLRVDNTSGTPQYSVGTYVPFQAQGVAANVPAADLGTGAWVHLVGTYDGANWNIYRNGTLLASAADAAGAVLVPGGNWALGARGRWKHMNVLASGLDRQFQGKIDEAAIYNLALSSNQVRAHYLLGKFGTTNAVAPSITSNPAPLTRDVGGTAQFKVVADGTSPFGYQWRKNGSSILSATNDTLTLRNVQTSDAAGYTVVVSNIVNSVTSSVATLTIIPATNSALVTFDSPNAFWRLDELYGTTAYDVAGGHDATYSGTVTLGYPGAISSADTAADFDGSTGRAVYPYSADLNPNGPFTVELWVLPHSVPNSSGTPCPVSSAANFPGNRSGWQIRERDTGWEFVMYNHAGSATALNIRGGSVPSTVAWTHLVAVYDGANGYLYVNGALAISGSAAGFVQNGSVETGPFTIGCRSSLDNSFQGAVDEVAFYSRALTPAEIQSHFANIPQLRIDKSGANVIVTWPAGALIESTNVTGPYAPTPSATSPYTVPPGAKQKFYRVQM